MTFAEWCNWVIGKKIDLDGFYGCQSPDIANHYAKSVFNDDGFVGNACELAPHHNDWLKINTPDIRVGDVALIRRNSRQMYGDCIVVTYVGRHHFEGIGAHVNTGAAGYSEYKKDQVLFAYRYLNLIQDIKRRRR